MPCHHCHHCHHNHEEITEMSRSASADQKHAGTRSVWRIANMDCPMEEMLIRKKLAAMPGINALEFNLMRQTLAVWHELPSAAPIMAALEEIDMAPQPVADKAPGLPPQAPMAWRKLAAAGALACASEAAHFWAGGNADFSPAMILSLLFAVAAIAVGGLSTWRKGWIALANRDPNINALMAVAVTGAALIGQFPEAAMVMVLFNLSEAIEARAMNRARKAIADLLDLAPAAITVRAENGEWQEKDARLVEPGAIARVRPGERIALDGRVLAGASSVNQAPITGESMPVPKTAGDLLYAGTINGEGALEFATTASANDTTLARIINIVEEAQATRAPIQRTIDIFARYYTPAVFAVALCAALLPPLLFGHAWAASIYTGLVLLVIGCPCALVISTPISIVSGMAAASRAGILIKGGASLERGRLLQFIALDKTGTLTKGEPKLTDFIPLTQKEEQSRAIAASLAAMSDHPVSRAIAGAMRANMQVEDFHAIPGQGIAGKIGESAYYLGNPASLKNAGAMTPAMAQRIAQLEDEGKTVVVLARGKDALAILAVADSIRPASAQAVAMLKKLGATAVMLTGDNISTARAIARQTGIAQFKASLLPEDKLHAIEYLRKGGALVGMAGDGINDAPALAKADISFAMAKNGADAAIETADVAIMDDDPRKIARFMQISRATWRILVENIAIALGIKAIFFILALLGIATMWMAVFADVGAALIVIGNGLRAARL